MMKSDVTNYAWKETFLVGDASPLKDEMKLHRKNQR